MTSQTFLKVNLIIVFDTKAENVLMCHRQKNPYKGLYNFVGGKKNPGESDIEGAYRELFEESGITVDVIEIKPLFFTQYFEDGIELQVFYGYLNQEVVLVPEKNPLLWMPITEDFSDDTRFAGQGNIKHMMDLIYESKQSM